MIQLKDVYKVSNEVVLKNVNIEINSSVVLFGPKDNKRLLFNLLYGLVKPDEGTSIQNKEDIFYIQENLYNKFKTAYDLINYYKTFYSIDNFEYTNEKLDSISYSKLSLLYVQLAVNSNAKYIFIDYFFEKVDIDTKQILRSLLNNSNKILVTIEHININADNYIFATETPITGSLSIVSSKYHKCVIELTEDIDLYIHKEVLDYFKQYEKYIVVLRNEDVSKFLEKVKPTVYFQTPFNYYDIEAIGDIL